MLRSTTKHTVCMRPKVGSLFQFLGGALDGEEAAAERAKQNEIST